MASQNLLVLAASSSCQNLLVVAASELTCSCCFFVWRVRTYLLKTWRVRTYLFLLLLRLVFFERGIVADKRQQYQNKGKIQMFEETPQKTSCARRRRALASCRRAPQGLVLAL